MKSPLPSFISTKIFIAQIYFEVSNTKIVNQPEVISKTPRNEHHAGFITASQPFCTSSEKFLSNCFNNFGKLPAL